jgi:gamma-glutamylcyclotransferase (GGCT)/AIG2-like uncharacterized protein YtfP
MPLEHLYFGYGSNLDGDDWARWCAENCPEIKPDGLCEVTAAYLPKYQMKFHYWSSIHQGGAADVVPSSNPNDSVPGVLFTMNDATLRAMDRKEGAPHVYKRVAVDVKSLKGSIVRAWTYVLTAAWRETNYTRPTEEYEGFIRNGLLSRGLPTSMLDRSLED